MRNLKRVLSLALALVMVLGMMVITTSAATYTDAEEITYTEAVDVMSALGIITGDNGKFNPKDTLSREGAAKLITYLLMGADKADKLVGSGNFDDVAADRWSAGSIDYCVSLGYIQGVGNNKFDPKGDMTVLGFGKLLLCALGYDATIEGYATKDWASNIVTDMIEAGLEVRGVNFDDVLTREVAAQMMLVALETSTVYYNGGKGTNITLADGTKVVMGAGTLTKTAGNGQDYTGGQNNANQELVEKLYPTLTITATTNTTFMRPAYEWQYTKVGQPAKYVLVEAEADKVYTAPVKASQIYADLGYTANSVTATCYLNGQQGQVSSTQNAINLTKTGTDVYGAPGVVTEVYKTAANTVTVVQTKYTLGYVNNVVSYPATAAVGAYTTYTINNVVANNSNVYVENAQSNIGTYKVFSSVVNRQADVDTVVLNGEFAKGDYVLIVTDATQTVGTTYIYPVTTATGNLTASSATTYTIGGIAYAPAAVTVAGGAASFATSLYSTQKPVTVVVDSYGNVIAPIQGASQAPTYVYVVGAENAWSLTGTTLSPSVTAYAVNAEGVATTMSVTKIGQNAIDGQSGNAGYDASDLTAGLYSYSLNKDGSTYTFTSVSQAVNNAFNYAQSAALANGVYGNANTVFYTITTKTVNGLTTVESVATTTGMANMGNVTTATGSYLKDRSNVATYVFLTTAQAGQAAKIVYYNGSYSFDGTDYVYDVILNGQAATIKTTLAPNVYFVDGLNNGSKGLYSIPANGNNAYKTTTPDGNYSDFKANYLNVLNTYGMVNNGGLLSVTETVISTGVATTTANVATVADNVPVYVIDAATGTCTTSTAAGLAVSGAAQIYVAPNAVPDAIAAIYIVK